VANNTQKSSAEGQYLTFQVKDQTFGLDILRVKEILEYANVTPIPLVPQFIRGILNLRGNVVPVIDLGRRFDWEITRLSRLTCIVVTEIEHEGARLDIGLTVDAVNEVVRLAPDNIGASPNFGTNVRADFISNVGKVGGKFVLLLNITKLLDAGEIQKLRDISLSGQKKAGAQI
jgi:purine-binding chemotaxis protein CheW